MKDKLRILPLGGCGEIGKNMTVIEYGDEILIIDAGIMFPLNDMLGIDYIIPDFKYLQGKADKIKAVLITHGHEDHIGAIGNLMEYVDAPIYATPLTCGLIQVKLQRANLAGKVRLETVEAGDTIHIGSFTVEPFHVAHSIPDCVGFGITTPVGLIVHTGDYKFDHTPMDGWPPDFAKLAEFSERNVLCLLADSTNAEREGWTPSEAVITEAFDELFRNNHEGRIIVASFASLISRIQQVANAAHKYGRKLAITGRSMRDNTKMAMRLGYLNIPDGLLIDISEADKHPNHKIAIMATGSQGEPRAVLSRLAFGRHRNLRIETGDTVVISAHTIPGNEESSNRIINGLFRQGADVLYEDVAQVHVSGHASREEMKLMINLVKPRFFIPIHGELKHLKLHAKMARDMGIPHERTAVVENGTPIELDQHELTVLPRLPGGYVFVDGESVGDVGFSIIRDREKLSQNGFFFAAFAVGKDGRLIGAPQFESRGFINVKAADDLLAGAEETIARMANTHYRDRKSLPNHVSSALEKYLYAETGRRPMVFTVIK
jgi:ribonuclease J